MKKIEDHERQASRRKLLKSILAGGGVAAAGRALPEQWTKPVVDSVLLPAHAQTTCGGITSYAGGVILNVVNGVVGADNGDLEKLLDMVVPRAVAQGLPTTATAQLCIECNGDGTINVRVLFSVDDTITTLTPYFTGNNIPIGQQRTLSQQNSCPIGPFAASIIVTSLAATAVGTLNLDVGNGEIVFTGGFGIGEGDCPIPASPDCGQIAEGP